MTIRNNQSMQTASLVYWIPFALCLLIGSHPARAMPSEDEVSVAMSRADRYGAGGWFCGADSGLSGTKEFGYTYFAGDGVAEKEYPSGRRVRTCPDELGRGKWVSATKTSADCVSGAALLAGDGYVSGVTYAAGGGMAQWTLGTGQTGAVKYNERDQPVRMRLSVSSNAEVVCGTTGDEWCIELGYGATAGVNNGNVREQKIWAKKGNGTYLNLLQTYDYDGLNRLTVFGESVLGGGSSGGSWTQTNGYDRWGNRWAVSSGAQSLLTPGQQSWIDAGTNRVVTATGGGTVGYLASGEMASHPQIGGMTWDVEGRMRGAGGAVFGYDGNGVRVKKVAGGVTTYFVGDGMGRLGAEYGGVVPVTSTRYVVADHLGSTRVVLDGAGVVTGRCDYSGFGETLDGTASVGNRDLVGGYWCGDGAVGVKYTGKERDFDTGLDYFGARYYSGGLGRFTSADEPFAAQRPEFPQTWNLYSYARNNPLYFTDPTGRQELGPMCNDGNPQCFEQVGQGTANLLIGFGKGLVDGATKTVDFMMNPLMPPLEDALPPQGAEQQIGNFVGEVVGSLGIGKLAMMASEAMTGTGPVMNLGSGSNPMAGAINIDIKAGAGVNVIASAEALPFRNNTFSAVHAINPRFEAGTAEIARTIQPGGSLFVTGKPGNSFTFPNANNSLDQVFRGPAVRSSLFGIPRQSDGRALSMTGAITSIFRKR